MGKFKEMFLNEASFKADKKNSMLYANGSENAYRIGIGEDEIVIFKANGFGNEYSEIKKIKYNLELLMQTIKDLKKDYPDIPSFSSAQMKQADLIHFAILKDNRSKREIYNYWLK